MTDKTPPRLASAQIDFPVEPTTNDKINRTATQFYRRFGEGVLVVVGVIVLKGFLFPSAPAEPPMPTMPQQPFVINNNVSAPPPEKTTCVGVVIGGCN